MEESSLLSKHDLFNVTIGTEDDVEINNEDVMLGLEEEISPMDIVEDGKVAIEEDDYEIEGEESSKTVVKISYDAKMRELLRNLCSPEIKIYSEAAKEFMKLLRSDSGGEFLNQYVEASSSCKELMDVWKLKQGKSGIAHVLSLISVVLDHPDGKYKSDDLGRINLSRRLDTFARSIINTKLEDIYTELSSKEARRQNAALSLMAATVRRGVGLASELAKIFNFKLPAFPKLAEYQKKKVVGKKGKYTTRRSFIEFAVSFLEVGNPRLLRWILQQKDMYFGVLRGLGSDDDETVVYVLSNLREKVLTPESLVPPGLRSVLFGTVTLDQLVTISGNPAGGPAAKIAYEVLVMVCTDPCNGLMPDMKDHSNMLKGNQTRILELMKKLNATEIEYHRDLLLAIVRGRPSFGSAYMDKFPYILEPRPSPTWFSAISLASDLVSSLRISSFCSPTSPTYDPPFIDRSEVQCLLKCIVPCAFSRAVINRGLLHPDALVRHGSMRLLLEALQSLESLIGAVGCSSCFESPTLQKGMALKQEIQDEIRALLPDLQVLLKLLSSHSYNESGGQERSLKRSRKSEESLDIHHKKRRKKKSDLVDEDIDIHISGIMLEADNIISKERENGTGVLVIEEVDNEKDLLNSIAQIWSIHDSSELGNELKDAEMYFHSKLLDAITLYLRTMPIAVEGSFDFFKILPSKPFTLSNGQQQSLLSLLIQYSGSPGSRASSIRLPEMMYKHLQPLINLLIMSPVEGIQDQAYQLARLAILSTGGFDSNHLEIDAWLYFLPGYRKDKFPAESQGVEVFQDWSAVVVSFLCDAISTMGNKLYEYMDKLRVQISSLQGVDDASPDFSPFFICILDKCLRLLRSDSRNFRPYDKSLISVYVSNTLSFILQTQVDGKLLSALINLILSEGIDNSSSVTDDSGNIHCEWRSLRSLLFFSQSISQGEAGQSLCSAAQNISIARSSSLAKTLRKTEKVIRNSSGASFVGVAKAFCSSIICAAPDEIVEHLPSVITFTRHLSVAPTSFLSCVLFHDQSLLSSIADRWHELFFSSLELVEAAEGTGCGKDDTCLLIRSVSTPSEEVISCMGVNSTETASAALSSFLKQTSFCVLFPSFLRVCASSLPDSTRIVVFLQAKLSEGSPGDSVASLRLLLFWIHQIQSSYRLKPSEELHQLSGTCFILIKHILEQLVILKSDFSGSKVVEGHPTTSCIEEVAESIIRHPVMSLSLFRPLWGTNEPSNGSLVHSIEDFLSSPEGNIHSMDNYALQFLTDVADKLLALGSNQSSLPEDDNAVYKRVVRAFMTLLQKVVFVFKQKFEVCIDRKDLLPICANYYILRSLLRFISPFMLLELVHWMFCKVHCKRDMEHFEISILSIGCYIANGAFDLLSSYLHQLNSETVRVPLLWQVECGRSDISLLEKVYHKVIEFAMCCKVECADVCLVKAVRVVYNQKFMRSQTALPPSSMAIWRVIMSSPLAIVDHCIKKTNTTRAKLLFLLTEVSPLHLTLFGQKLSGIMNKDLPLKVTGDHNLTDKEFIMFLPVALSYLDLHFVKFGARYLKHFGSITSFYSRIVLDGFLSWKSYTSQKIFQEELDEVLPSSAQDLFNMFSGSLLGKAIHMLQYYFALNVDTMREEAMKLFESICPFSGIHDDLFDCDVKEIYISVSKHPLNIINAVVAKIYFCRMLLFPTEHLIQCLATEIVGDPKETPSGVESNRLRFINLLVSTLHKIVKRFPLASENTEKSKCTDCSKLFRYLEAFILRNIVELSAQIQHDLIQPDSILKLEELARFSLLYRFEDPTTLKALRHVLILLSERKFPFGSVFELVLAHSQFIPSILWSDSSFDSSGTLFRPMSSLLKSRALLSIDENRGDYKLQMSPPYMRKLEVIKLLRVLYHLKARQSKTSIGEEASMNPRELLSLLLSCYHATMSEIDLELFDLMQEIACAEGSDFVGIAEMDYLWGGSALKLRRDRKLDSILSSNNMNDSETTQECNRRQFRENIALDSKLCAATVVNFPYDRVADRGPLNLKKLQQEFIYAPETPSAVTATILRYDPVFILRFSNHCLSAGYLEPLEFAGLGLLAVAFMSISCLDEGIRKLGYEVLGRFNNALENRRKRKDELQIRFLVTYLQNAIGEPWQRIPSMTAIFASEASFVLLDPSNDHYHTISKLLMSSREVNLKCIPLFHTMFGSTSVNFKADRLWILRLSYAGLNLDDDVQIFKRKCLPEILLSYYASSLSDNESRMLILQIVKKSVKLPELASYLVERCSLILWLSSILSFCAERSCDAKSPFLTQMVIVLEAVNDVISSREIVEWLQIYAFEQLSELSSHAVKILVDSFEKIKQNVTIITALLEVSISTMSISQKRDVYQPHYTLSFGILYQLYEAICDGCSKTGFDLSAELGLRFILMSAPTISMCHTDGAKLLKFIMWGASIALRLHSKESILLKESGDLPKFFGEQDSEDSLLLKLLRWVTASVILGRVSRKPHKSFSENSSVKNLQFLLEHIDEENNDCRENGKGEVTGTDCVSDEGLAASIMYLQQVIGMDCDVLPSVILALYLLLPSSSSNNKGKASPTGEQGNDMASMCFKIRVPPEANPAWRWSYYQPWKDDSSEFTELQKLEEHHACQSLLVMFSNSLSKELLKPTLSHLDVENSGIFSWERDILTTELSSG